MRIYYILQYSSRHIWRCKRRTTCYTYHVEWYSVVWYYQQIVQVIIILELLLFIMSVSLLFNSFAPNWANNDESDIWYTGIKGESWWSLGHRASIKPFISVFILGRVTTVARPLLTEHWALKTGGWWVAVGGGSCWLLAAAAVVNSFCNLIIIAIFGAIKTSIFPLMAFTSCHIHTLVLISSTDWAGEDERMTESEDSQKLQMEYMKVRRGWERGQKRHGEREGGRDRPFVCVQIN